MTRGLLVALCLAACGPAATTANEPTDSAATAFQAYAKSDVPSNSDSTSDSNSNSNSNSDSNSNSNWSSNSAPTPLAPAPSDPRDLRWLLIAGGPEPSSNQIQIAHDAERALAHLGPDGQLLFAGGPDSPSVLANPPDHATTPGDPLIRRLADLFAPRAGRNATYRAAPFAPHAATDATRVATALEAALTAATASPLTVLLIGHGDRADGPDDAAFATWGGGWLTPADLAPPLERATRPVRFIVATCYAGGWAPVIFKHDGACGVFATTWDRVASGCDPDPDRSAQEGYLVRLFAALDLDAPDRTAFDRDGDGEIGLLDAHFAAAAASRGLEVPVASSSEYLLTNAPQAGPEARAPLGPMPEETWLAERLTARLVDPSEDAATPLTRARVDRKLAELSAAATPLEAAVTDATDHEADTLATARGEALARWPALDDPWHPDWVPTFATHKDAIAAWLRTSPAYAAWVDATEALDRAHQAADTLDAERTLWLRLARAHHTLTAARRLAALPAARRTPIWARFMALRTCERRPLP